MTVKLVENHQPMTVAMVPKVILLMLAETLVMLLPIKAAVYNILLYNIITRRYHE
jgi:hypothetical protein